MPTVRQFLETAKADDPVYISDVRDAFQRDGVRSFRLYATLYDGSTRRFSLKLPACSDPEETAFVEEYLNATIYNILSALGAREIGVSFDSNDAFLTSYAAKLDEIFQVNVSIASRTGYGKCLNVNQRVLASLCGSDVHFRFTIVPADSVDTCISDAPETGETSVFAALPVRAEHGRFMGMDIGGTDIKLTASLDGHLCAFKEYDWNPAAFTRAEQLTGPLVMLTRLMRAAVSMSEAGLSEELPLAAFDRAAADTEVEAAINAMEALLGERLRNLDGIGLCFPDVVIRNRIVGGETPKTQGMRGNAELDYETEFRKLSNLNELLAGYVRPGGVVMNTNDGPMAAFTTAVEEAADGRKLSEGFFAHSLGTDLGTGWILPNGTIPEIPLEVYNFIIDLGSFTQRTFDPRDVRSTRNFGTGLPGSLQKYGGQFGVFRLAAKHLPDADPALLQRAIDTGLFRREGESLTVPTAPEDMRKPCLEFFMQAAADAGSPAAELFRAVGEAIGVTWRETQYILQPACCARTLFGRLVKTKACFDEICEGAHRIVPDLYLEAADKTLAVTPLMKQLAQHPVYTIAQFAQAVGAVYYACAGMPE